MVCFQLILLQKYGLFFICANVMVQLFLFKGGKTKRVNMWSA